MHSVGIESAAIVEDDSLVVTALDTLAQLVDVALMHCLYHLDCHIFGGLLIATRITWPVVDIYIHPLTVVANDAVATIEVEIKGFSHSIGLIHEIIFIEGSMLGHSVMPVVGELHFSIVIGIIKTEERSVAYSIEFDKVALDMSTNIRPYPTLTHSSLSSLARLLIRCEHHIILTLRIAVGFLHPIAILTLWLWHIKTTGSKMNSLEFTVLAVFEHRAHGVYHRHFGCIQFHQSLIGTSHRDICLSIFLKTEIIFIHDSDVKPALS